MFSHSSGFNRFISVSLVTSSKTSLCSIEKNVIPKFALSSTLTAVLNFSASLRFNFMAQPAITFEIEHKSAKTILQECSKHKRNFNQLCFQRSTINLKFSFSSCSTSQPVQSVTVQKEEDECRRLPPVTAWYTPSTLTDKTWAHRDILCPYLKTKITKLLSITSLDKLPPPSFL